MTANDDTSQADRRARPLRGARARNVSVLGDEPALDQSGDRAVPTGLHALSLRWLAGTVFVGLGGAALIGSSIYLSLDRQAQFAASPQLVRARGAEGDAVLRPDSSRKGDRLVTAVDIAASRQAFKAPVTLRVADREIIRTRGFVRVAAGLSLRQSADVEVPPFNPLRLMAESGNEERIAESPVDQDDAEVSILKTSLSGARIEGPALSDPEALTQVQQAASQATARGAVSLRAIPLPDLFIGRSLTPAPVTGVGAYAPAGDTAFSTIEVRMAPENVTEVAKTPKAEADRARQERLVVVGRGDTLAKVAAAHGASRQQVAEIVAALRARDRNFEVEEGHRLRLLTEGGREGRPGTLLRVAVHGEESVLAIAALDDRGAFVPVAPPEAPRQVAADDEEDDERAPSLYRSLYETGLKNELPKNIIAELVRIFAYDVDFQRRTHGGDGVEVLLAEAEDGDPEKAEILFAALTAGGETRRFYRFQQGDDGAYDYFDEQGKSAKKFLLRTPITSAVFRSGFGMRRHPILRYTRMHTGVDWAGKIGTPIFSAGNGTVIKAAWDSGYGRRVEVQHTNGYVTSYSHMSGFARGIQPGVRVRQGQVIGYLGSSGLSTGPHLHYEVIVNGHYVDPMRIKLPRGRELDGRQLAEFRRERERIAELLAKGGAPTRLAENRPR
jgi:murein DD-endopeptidase MepM/ murein hydrolase activator NlpD